MKQSLKGGLLSALVFPGLGHLVLKSALRGWIYILLTLLCFGLLVSIIIPIVTSTVNEVTSGTLPADPNQLNRIVHEKMADSDGLRGTVALVGFVGIWLVALIDVILLGRRQDAQAKASRQDAVTGRP